MNMKAVAITFFFLLCTLLQVTAHADELWLCKCRADMMIDSKGNKHLFILSYTKHTKSWFKDKITVYQFKITPKNEKELLYTAKGTPENDEYDSAWLLVKAKTPKEWQSMAFRFDSPLDSKNKTQKFLCGSHADASQIDIDDAGGRFHTGMCRKQT